MANKDRNVQAATYKGRLRTSGRLNVTYRNGAGRTRTALVLGAGSTSGLKLQVGDQIIDNVALATSRTQTNVYHSRG